MNVRDGWMVSAKQLPEGMEHCTIEFKECAKGHGRLHATNWVEHGCPQCVIEQLQKDLGKSITGWWAAEAVPLPADKGESKMGDTVNTVVAANNPVSVKAADVPSGQMFRYVDRHTDNNVYMKVVNPHGSHSVVGLRNGQMYSNYSPGPVEILPSVTITRR